MARLSSAFSSWFASQSVLHRPPEITVSTWMAGPTVRRIRSSIEVVSRLMSTAFGSSVCRREKASRRWVSDAARLAEVTAAPM